MKIPRRQYSDLYGPTTGDRIRLPIASLFVVSDSTDTATWTALRRTVEEILDAWPGDVVGGVTEPPVPGLAVKLTARSTQNLAAAQDALWHAIRSGLLGL